MSASALKQLSFLVLQVGKCPKCMRMAAGFAATTWVAFALWAISTNNYQSPFVLLPAAATMLWLLHIVGFGVRGIMGLKLSGKDDGESVPIGRVPTNRRDFIVSFVKLVGFAAAVSVIPRLAVAQGCGGDLDCGFSRCVALGSNASYCCPPGYQVLNTCTCRCHKLRRCSRLRLPGNAAVLVTHTFVVNKGTSS